MGKKVLLALVLVGIFVSASQGNAALITLGADHTFNGSNPTGPAPWVTATFDDHAGSGSVTLTLSADRLGGREFVSNWYFNFNPKMALSSLSITQTPGQGPTATIATGIDKYKADGDGYYDIRISFPTNSHERFTSGTASFTIIGSGITAGSFRFSSNSSAFPYLAAAHIQGIGANPSSGWVSFSQVPIPPSFLLLGSGLLGMIGIKCRRSQVPGRRLRLVT